MRNYSYTDDPYFQVHEFCFYHPFLTREYTILHASDLHIMMIDENSSPDRIEKVTKQKKAWEGVRIGFAQTYGDDYGPEHLLDPADGLEHLLFLVNKNKPDAFLMSGDMMEDFSAENLNTLKKAFDQITVPWMWVCGNHEVGHSEEYKPFMKGTPELQTMDIGELRFIGIDDAAKKVSAAQLDGIKEKTRDSNLPILMMHIPMLTSCSREKMKHFNPYFLLGTGDVDQPTREFIDFMESDEDPFAMVLCGHVHGLNVSEYRTGHPQLCASSCMVGTVSLIRLFPGDTPELKY